MGCRRCRRAWPHVDSGGPPGRLARLPHAAGGHRGADRCPAGRGTPSRRSLGQAPSPCVRPQPGDRRFEHPSWQRWPFDVLTQAFLLGEQWWQENDHLHHCKRLRRTGPHRPGVDHEVLHPRPETAGLPGALSRGAGAHGLRRLVAQPRRCGPRDRSGRLPQLGVLAALDATVGSCRTGRCTLPATASAAPADHRRRRLARDGDQRTAS